MMEKSAHTQEQILERLPRLLNSLRNEQHHDVAELTQTRVLQHIQGLGAAGVYAFFRKGDGVPVYVGRSANLIQRLGSDHRSTLENQAAVTKAIKVKLGLQSMGQAREILYRDYDVCFMAEPDVATRAMLEIFASLKWDTEFNTFIEH